MKNNRGFTLLEILLVIGIIAILAGIVIIAINPGRQLARVRDTERRVDIVELNKALTQYYIDEGHFPTSLDTNLKNICDTGDSASSTVDDISCINKADLSLLVPKYLPAIPTDPTGVSYEVGINQITSKPMLIASLTEIGPVIMVGTTTPEVEVVSGCNDATNSDCWSADNVAGGLVYWAVNPKDAEETGAQSSTNGKTNTSHVINSHANGLVWNAGSDYPAFAVCDQLDYNDHHDWYLPAIQQFVTAKQANVAGFSQLAYWSSSEVTEEQRSGYSPYTAWFYKNIYDETDYNGKWERLYIRCMR